MTIAYRTRAILTHCAVAILAISALWMSLSRLLDYYFINAFEQRLADDGRILGGMIGTYVSAFQVSNMDSSFVQDYVSGLAPQIDMRVRVLDAKGKVLADSSAAGQSDEELQKLRAADYTGLPEVKQALAGKVGSTLRGSLFHRNRTLFVAVPVRHENKIIGAVYLSHNATEILGMLTQIRGRLRSAAWIAVLLAVVLSVIVGAETSAPLRRVSQAVERAAREETDAAVPALGERELRSIAEAVNRLIRERNAASRARREFVEQVTGVVDPALEELREASRFAETTCNDSVSLPTLRRVSQSADHLQTTLGRLSLLSRLQAGLLTLQQQEFDLRDAVSSAVEEIAAAAAERSLKMKASIPKELPSARGDRDWFRWSVTEVLRNAVQFSEPDGTITIQATVSETSLGLKIIDTGCGMVAKDLKCAKNEFFRGAAAETMHPRGMGLGLTLVDHLLGAQSAELIIQSQPGEGTTVTITVPRHAPGPIGEQPAV